MSGNSQGDRCVRRKGFRNVFVKKSYWSKGHMSDTIPGLKQYQECKRLLFTLESDAVAQTYHQGNEFQSQRAAYSLDHPHSAPAHQYNHFTEITVYFTLHRKGTTLKGGPIAILAT
ncbi:hypothetical protein TNCV_679301 [Trichonephila clavipes]|nr:hypothetical protein TNCV_679301 [Trichonephila clavipes]